MEKVKFASGNKSQLLSLMKQRIDQYFKTNNISQYANAAMKFKIALWLSLWLISIVALYFTSGNAWLTFFVGFFHMFTHVMIAFNIAHDANHGALSPNAKTNRLFAYSLDLIGSNSELWRFSHNQQHHTFVNIDGHDGSVEGYKLFRFCPAAPRYWYHRYQHLYAPVIYGISTINYVTGKDFKLLKQYVQTNGGKDAANIGFMARLIAWKLFYFGYLIILPIFVFKLSIPAVIAFFLSGHILDGSLLAFIFQTGHITNGTSYPEVENNQIDKNWAVHIVETTGDYAAKSFWMQWFCGAINIHVIHHLFPKICHTHYRKLAPLIKRAAQDLGIEYKEFPTFYDAVASHFNELKMLGTEDYYPEQKKIEQRA